MATFLAGTTIGGVAAVLGSPKVLPATSLNAPGFAPYTYLVNDPTGVMKWSAGFESLVPSHNASNGFVYYTSTPTDTLEKFPYAITSGTSTVIGTETSLGVIPAGGGSSGHVGISSQTEGFLVGAPGTIRKFPFAIGPTPGAITTATGNSFSPPVGGNRPNTGHATSSDAFITTNEAPVGAIRKFPFAIAAPGVSTTVGTMAGPVVLTASAGISSSGHAWIVSGNQGPSQGGQAIQKFPFAIAPGGVATSQTLSIVGSPARAISLSGWNFPTKGIFLREKTIGDPAYPTAYVNELWSFPYEIGANESVVNLASSLADIKERVSSHSGATNGFATGGFALFGPGVPSPGVQYNLIEKFPYLVANNTAVTVGGLTYGGPASPLPTPVANKAWTGFQS